MKTTSFRLDDRELERIEKLERKNKQRKSLDEIVNYNGFGGP